MISIGYFLNLYSLSSFNIKRNVSSFDFLIGSFMNLVLVNDLDIIINKSLSKNSFIHKIFSYVSLRYYLLLSFFGIGESKIYHFSPYVILYLLASKIYKPISSYLFK